MHSIIAIFIGSGLGGVCRWALGTWLNGQHPYGTLAANVLGCFLLGLLSKHVPANDQVKLLLTTGFCGGFTTFSTFINEDLSMMRGGQLAIAIIYMVASITLGILGAWAGWRV